MDVDDYTSHACVGKSLSACVCVGASNKSLKDINQTRATLYV